MERLEGKMVVRNERKRKNKKGRGRGSPGGKSGKYWGGQVWKRKRRMEANEREIQPEPKGGGNGSRG